MYVLMHGPFNYSGGHGIFGTSKNLDLLFFKEVAKYC
jgi:hypothetical protein